MSLNTIIKIARINPYDDRIFKYFNSDLYLVPKEILKIQYKKSEAKILAQKYGVSINTLYGRLHDLGIKLKGASEAMRQYRLKGKQEPSREELVKFHEEEGLSIPAIAKRLGFSTCYIRNRFKRDEINYTTPKRKLRKKPIKEFSFPKPKIQNTKQGLKKITDSTKKINRIDMDFESYIKLENMAKLDGKDFSVIKEIIKFYVGEMYDDIIKGFSALNKKKLSTRLICSSLLKVIKKLGYKLCEINTNDDLHLETITKSFLPEIREEFKRVREKYSLVKEDRLEYMLYRLNELR